MKEKMMIIGKKAREVSCKVQHLGQTEKNEGLYSVARELLFDIKLLIIKCVFSKSFYMHVSLSI